MSAPKIGGLFAGYGGLEMGVQSVLGGELAWYADCCKFDKNGNAGHYEPHRAPCSIQIHHNPGVPNLGDVTAVDWSQVEPVDILTGGSPCQDLSHAGKRAGMTDGTRSNLWVAMREAIAQLRPSLVVWENVRGAYSADADSGLEHCPGCMGEGRPGTVLRALGRVLGDLSDLGYDAGWHGLRAADVGAPHGRMRVFVVAYPASGERPYGTGRDDTRGPLFGSGVESGARDDASGDLMFPSAVALLPTPAVNDMGAAYTPDEWDAWTDRMKAEHGNGNGHGPSLSIEAQRLLDAERTSRWGQYGIAIHRWESLTRHAPDATQTSTKGNPQLAPAFVEWMMGLPAGHVTDTPGITRNEALKALGNGVVPAQAAAALRFLLSVRAVAA